MDDSSKTAWFAAAVDLALRSGTLRRPSLASALHSHAVGRSYALMDQQGRLIERFSLPRVRAWAGWRERLLARLEWRALLARLPLGERRLRFRSRPARERALAWALSIGRPWPPGRFGSEELLFTLALGALCLLPGLLYLIWALRRAVAFGGKLAAIEGEWRLAGAPDPVDPAFVALVSS